MTATSLTQTRVCDFPTSGWDRKAMRNQVASCLIICFLSVNAWSGGNPSWQNASANSVSAAAASRQTPKKRAKKVYTNDDLQSLRGSRPPNTARAETKPTTSPSGDTEASRTTVEDAEETAENPIPQEQDPSYWSQRVEPLQQELAKLEEEITRLRQLAGSLHPSQTGQGLDLAEGGSSLNPQQTIDNLERRKQAVESELESIAEQARRARVPPGWLR